MTRILLAVVLGVSLGAVAQTAQPAQGQSSAPAQGSQSQAPVIKDPAEYNAYVAAVQQTDPNAKISGLEAFLTQYPNSVMKTQALEILMGVYQQTNNIAKTLATANKVIAADPCNERALALLSYFDRMMAQGGQGNTAEELADGKKDGEQGISCFDKVTDPEIKKMQPQMTSIFDSAIGIADLQQAGAASNTPQQKQDDYAEAIKYLKPAVDANPTDFSVVYPLALSYWPDPKTPTTPDNSMNAIWYAARASAVAPQQAQAQIEKYAHSLYVRYHAGEDGWTDVLAKAKADSAPPADLSTLIKPAPTPAEQAHSMIGQTSPDKMDFATWEFILTNGTPDDQATVWNAIKGKAVQMVGAVISTTPTQFMIAGSSDDIGANKADITLNFEDKVPVKLIPKTGDQNFQFQGEPSSYTSNPFMMVMDKGQLLRSKPETTKKPAHKSAQ
jgi:tetratricopeptide (TPR) repeat protein